MKFTVDVSGREQALVKLVTAAFTASEGSEEGALIGKFVRNVLTETPPKDMRVFCAEDGGNIVGVAVFTRLIYPEDPQIVFLLSPMAVAPMLQRQGVGRTLISHALDALRYEGVQAVFTYGDPNYYGRVGFIQISEGQARAPLKLGMPHGWLAQSLDQKQMPALRGPSVCVPALNRTDIW